MSIDWTREKRSMAAVLQSLPEGVRECAVLRFPVFLLDYVLGQPPYLLRACLVTKSPYGSGKVRLDGGCRDVAR